MEHMVLTRREAAEHMRISLPTLDNYIRRAENPLPILKSGKRVLIPADDLRKWLSEEAARCMGNEVC